MLTLNFRIYLEWNNTGTGPWDTLSSTDVVNVRNHSTNSVHAVYMTLYTRGQERRSHLSSEREISLERTTVIPSPAT